jgi:hypothetical protein
MSKPQTNTTEIVLIENLNGSAYCNYPLVGQYVSTFYWLVQDLNGENTTSSVLTTSSNLA